MTVPVNEVRKNGEIVRALGGTVNQARRLLFLAEKGFAYGVKIPLEVNDAQTNLKQAQANLARAQRDYLVARMNLPWVTGILGEAPPSQEPRPRAGDRAA
ncbi:hypothetical protein DFAR_3990056 [Desulfarculales bacterium]